MCHQLFSACFSENSSCRFELSVSRSETAFRYCKDCVLIKPRLSSPSPFFLSILWGFFYILTLSCLSSSFLSSPISSIRPPLNSPPHDSPFIFSVFVSLPLQFLPSFSLPLAYLLLSPSLPLSLSLSLSEVTVKQQQQCPRHFLH